MMPCTVSGSTTSPGRVASMRVNSSAYRGLPPACSSSRACTSASTADWPSRACRSWAVSCSESGESRSVDELTLPPPQPGRRERSSGRAVASTSIGTPLAQSTRCSTKSRSRSSAQCRSSNTRTSGRSSAIASRKRRQAANDSSRRSPAHAPSISRPASGRSWRSIHAASAASSMNLATACRSFSPACSGASDSRIPACAFTISPSAQKVTPSPYGGERPCRQKTRPKSPALDRLEELVHEAALADPGDADQRDELRLALADDARQRLAEERQLLLAADERARLRPARRRRALVLARPSRPAPAPTFPSRRPRRRRRTRSRARSPGTSSRRRGSRRRARRSGGARRCSRRRPRPCLRRRSGRAPRATSASPVVIPIRISSSPSSASASRMESAARTARSGSSSCATGAPKTAMTASPMNFSTVPPKRSSSARTRAW